MGEQEEVPAFVQAGDKAMSVLVDAATRMTGVAMEYGDDSAVTQNAAVLMHDMLHVAMDRYGYAPVTFYAARVAAELMDRVKVDVEFAEGRFFRDPESGVWTWQIDGDLDDEQVQALRLGARLIVGAIDLVGMAAPDEATAEQRATYMAWLGDVEAQEYPCMTLSGVVSLYGTICAFVGRHVLYGGAR